MVVETADTRGLLYFQLSYFVAEIFLALFKIFLALFKIFLALFNVMIKSRFSTATQAITASQWNVVFFVKLYHRKICLQRIYLHDYIQGEYNAWLLFNTLWFRIRELLVIHGRKTGREFQLMKKKKKTLFQDITKYMDSRRSERLYRFFPILRSHLCCGILSVSFSTSQGKISYQLKPLQTVVFVTLTTLQLQSNGHKNLILLTLYSGWTKNIYINGVFTTLID